MPTSYVDGEGYLHPFEEKTSDLEYPTGKFKVHRLQWKAIPFVASGVYQCYDATDLDIPYYNIILDVLSNN